MSSKVDYPELENGRHGSVFSISGPVIIAENMRGCCIADQNRERKDYYINLRGNKYVLQAFAQLHPLIRPKIAGGIAVGDPVTGTGQPQAVELGPGLMGTIYDGIQRPLEAISSLAKTIYIPRGIDVPSLNREKSWNFKQGTFRVGDHVTGGNIWGSFIENNLLDDHKIMLPRRARGQITRIAEAGSYTVTEKLLAPVCVSRLVTKRLRCGAPLLTRQRTLDTLFPYAQGGTVYIPSAFGSGKTVISQSISKFSNSDIVIYVGCGERGHKMAEVLMEFSMYFYDQGKNITLIANSTSYWAKALREISSHLGKIPTDQGFPTYLRSKLASFYKRTGQIVAHGSPKRKSSISIISTVSPPSRDFLDPVTSYTLSIIQVFWGLNRKLAQRKYFPSINIALSYSKYLALRDKIKELLYSSHNLKQLTQLVSKAALNNNNRISLNMASLAKEGFLQ
ncbi:H(+)-transporting V1 sector ATPase subunit A [Penicillium herquei]|nr:H(+)-transporting V1 sector ATPase subunit A [Penicillium herquei]